VGWITGEGAKTVLPPKHMQDQYEISSEAGTDKIEKLFIDFVNKITPKTVKVEIKGLHHGKGAITPIDSVWIKAASRAMERHWKKPVFIREGGSIPIVVSFEEILGVSTVLLGFGLPDENAHSPDEHLNLNNFKEV